jgi:hypothetical protein
MGSSFVNLHPLPRKGATSAQPHVSQRSSAPVASPRVPAAPLAPEGKLGSVGTKCKSFLALTVASRKEMNDLD